MKVAIYVRLSEEDRDKRIPSDESESIQNQKSLLLNHAVSQGWEVYGIYSDEDYAGSDRGRPAFNRLLDDAEQGRFDIVLCKTQSRFTRELELVERYIHGLFPQWGVRFVSVVDHADSENRGNKKARQINGLINEWFLEDLSDNIKSVLADKRRAGKYLGSFALYGYSKDAEDRNHLVVDPAAAAVVKRVFALYLSGVGANGIADALNAEGVPNPTLYKQSRGMKYSPPKRSARGGLWSAGTVLQMLKNRMYAGDMVQGRLRKPSYKSPALVRVPEGEWAVVRGTHEGIVSEAEFERVQARLGVRTRACRDGMPHPFAGRLFCGQCGSAINSNTAKGIKYLRCSASVNGACGNNISVRLDALEAAVLAELRAQLEALGDGEVLAERFKEADRDDVPMCRDNAAELERKQAMLDTLYMDRLSGLIDEKQYAAFRERIAGEIEALEGSAERGEIHAVHDCREQAHALLHPERLDRVLAEAFVERVELMGGDAREAGARITWRF